MLEQTQGTCTFSSAGLLAVSYHASGTCCDLQVHTGAPQGCEAEGCETACICGRKYADAMTSDNARRHIQYHSRLRSHHSFVITNHFVITTVIFVITSHLHNHHTDLIHQ